MAPPLDTRKISRPGNSDQKSLVKALLEGMGESFFAVDRDWRVTACNGAAGEILGAPNAKVVGRLLWDARPQLKGTEFERHCRRVMQERKREEFESYSALGLDRYHEVRAFPFGDGVGVAFRDITDRQRATQALRSRELELARVQRIGGVGGLEVHLADGFRSPRSPEYLHLHGLPADFV